MNVQWLPWLTEDEKVTLTKSLLVAQKEIGVRHWGALATGKFNRNQPRFLITDIRGVALISGIIRYHLCQMNSRIFYRGQTNSYSLTPSVYRTKGSPITVKERKSAIQWLDKVLQIAKEKFDPKGEDHMREALAQHYGLKTRWLDVVDHFQMAAWFAYDGSQTHVHSDLQNGMHDDSVGYIFIVAVPNEPNHTVAMWRDLREKPSNWLRPHIQQAFSIRLTDTESYGGSLDWLAVCQLVVPRDLLHQWSGYSHMTRSHVYPGKKQDPGFEYWENASARIREKGINITPPQLR